MASGSTEVLLFDVMDTLVVDPFYEHIPAFFGLSLEELLEAKHPTAWVEFERGELTCDQYYAKMFADGRAFDGGALERHLRSKYRFVDGVSALLSELAQRGHEMHALSNYPEWYRLVDEALELSRYVPWTFVSCKTGRRKPDEAAYLEAARAVGRPPERCLLIDDRPQNCRAADGVGMQAVRFENAAALRSELAARGLVDG